LILRFMARLLSHQAGFTGRAQPTRAVLEITTPRPWPQTALTLEAISQWLARDPSG
jgi:hypothetical protein